jgi:hypothetical protein
MYESVRDHDWYGDTRALIEEQWARYQPLCSDPKFRNKAMNEFNACTWQMYLACVLLDHGHVLERSGDDAPDIKIRQPDGSVVWIEATTAEPGEGANAAVRVYSWRKDNPETGSSSGLYTFDEQKQILRYQNAISKKNKHRNEFIERKAIAPSDPYIIAINAGEIDDAEMHDGVENIVRAVYPIGQLAYAYRVRTDFTNPDEPFDHEGHWTRAHTPAVKTPKNVDSSTMTFADGSLPGVSALIFSARAIWNAPTPTGRECVTIYNATSSHQIAPYTFRFGKSYHGDGENLHRVNWWMREQISVAAYYRWLARGGPNAAEGALADWLEAEHEIIARKLQ